MNKKIEFVIHSVYHRQISLVKKKKQNDSILLLDFLFFFL